MRRSLRPCWNSAPGWCWSGSPATASRAGLRCCRRRSTSFALPPCAARSRRSAGRSRFEMPPGGIHATGGVWRRHPGGARRHVRSLRPGAAPRADPGRLVGLFPLAPLRKASGLTLSACRCDVEEGPGDARPRGGHGRHRKRRRPGPLPSRTRTAGRAPAIHRFVPPFPQRGGIPLLHRKGLAAAAGEIPADDLDGGMRRGPSHLLARFRRHPRTARGSPYPPVWASSPTCVRSTWKRTW